MKRFFTLLIVPILILSFIYPIYAADGRVIYNGKASNFVFEPGSKHSLTDLFSNFKEIMPGDTLTQKITIKNKAENNVKVKIYLRSLGARDDSKKFLSQLGLRVRKSEENKMAYMFDSAANETAQLTDWVCLGMLYSGGEINLDVTLDVPVSLSNDYKNMIEYLDWEFMVEEFPVEHADPDAPQAGDDSYIGLWLTMMFCLIVLLIILFVSKKKYKDNEEIVIKG